MKKLLIFDAYGTLISTGNGSIQATEKILALQNQDINAVEFYAKWRKYHRKHLEECNAGVFMLEQDVFVKDLKCLYEEYQIDRPYEKDVQIMLDSLKNRIVFPEVIDAIENLRKINRVVIGSTTDTEPLLENMRYNNLSVDEVYTSERIRKYKPAEDFYQYILRCEACKNEEAVFIGDSLVDDVLGSQKVGLTTVWVNRKNQISLSETIKPDYVVNRIDEMKFFLQ